MTIAASDTALEVEVTGGRIAGSVRGGLRMWRGIPYAAPPVGRRRLRAPEPVVPWSGVRSAAEFGAVAYQDRDTQVGVGTGRLPRSEDCLTLNVIAPDDEVAGRPVMVFIHGGAYLNGSSREIPHLGEALVREGGVVFVNLNYRLGALGYLDFRRYGSEARPFDANLGLRDQVAALAWVRDNIRAFGGDPDAVTVFGESAGANAVTTLLATPSARGLFARAIAESSPVEAIYTEDVAQDWAGVYVDILRELTGEREVDVATLLSTAGAGVMTRAAVLMQRRFTEDVPGTAPFSPVIDGDVLPERPSDAVAAGRSARVPLIIGTNEREGTLFRGRLDLLASTKPRIRAIFAKTERDARRNLFSVYRALPARTSAAQFAGDYSFWYPSIKYAEGHAQHAPVWFYRFDIAPRVLHLTGFGATHGIELFAVFDLIDTPIARLAGILGGRGAFRRAGSRVRNRWLEFARSGTVGTGWPTYDVDARRTLVIDEPDRVEADPLAERRTAWQAFVPYV
ncbi:carboxylesterase/lipase family protein [Galbitalea sp. SE-J8]|uniref:carboxylesterase/lipase family protein n=1 Tax=Galbitalea sp. SE-J8 TaxID=3054952 RepID=UPI00259C84A6|nr:carboxylesterase/lipase family protein [Galbitalea sp. SE-J8]MDM4763194.1 carboxylesterase/lipase family protein [Galbitalea sp. SE-J8]